MAPNPKGFEAWQAEKSCGLTPVSNAQTFPRDAIGRASSRYPEKSKKSGCRLLLMSNSTFKLKAPRRLAKVPGSDA
jgi:hypothetical protein